LLRVPLRCEATSVAMTQTFAQVARAFAHVDADFGTCATGLYMPCSRGPRPYRQAHPRSVPGALSHTGGARIVSLEARPADAGASPFGLDASPFELDPRISPPRPLS